MLTFGSLFAGIGGIDLGFERAGLVCKWQVEKDEWARRVLKKHWPDVPRYEDVYHVGRANLESVDVVAGGFPCQPHSVAGKRRGEADDRNLWPEFRRIVAELQPAWVVGENVPGIISLYLDTVLSDLEGLGYETAAISLPAGAFGAPHKRERVFILAHAERKGLEKRTAGGLEYAVLPTQQRGLESRGLLQWEAEPGVGRVVNGLPMRIHRTKGLGNAVVPQVAEFLGKKIIEVASL